MPEASSWHYTMTRRAQEIICMVGLDPCAQLLSAADVNPYVPVKQVARFQHLLPPRAPRYMATIADWTALGLYVATGIVTIVLVCLHAYVKPMDDGTRELVATALIAVVVVAAFFQIISRDIPTVDGEMLFVHAPKLEGMQSIEVLDCNHTVRFDCLRAEVLLSSSLQFEPALSQAFTLRLDNVQATPTAASAERATLICQTEEYLLREDERAFLASTIHELLSMLFWDAFQASQERYDRESATKEDLKNPKSKKNVIKEETKKADSSEHG